MSELIHKLCIRLANLRYELRDAGKARRHRYQIVDRETGKIVARFDELIYAENALKQYQEHSVRELEHECDSAMPVSAA